MRMAMRWKAAAAILLTASAGAYAEPERGDEPRKAPFGAGIVLSGEATSKSVGLPIMPGAVRREKADGEGNGLTLALWGGEFGFKVAVLMLETGEPIGDVAAYYKDEMRRYGTVLDCSPGQPRTKSGGDKNALECEGRSRANGKHVFKVGTKNNHRLVNIEPHGKQVQIDIVRVLATTD